MNHIQITIEATEEEQEILISELSELNAIGFEQTDTHLLAYFNEENFKNYDINNILKNNIFHQANLPEQNWNTLWESTFHPVILDDFCAIRAYFHQPIKNVRFEIIITPKMSFGTGHHATTYMMMEQMRNISFSQKTVFDFGTGTGILSILAKKLGAASITAIDNDEWSIKNAEENFIRNKVHGTNLKQSSLVSGDMFDIILANINKNVLLQFAPSLVNILSTNGILLMSGLLVEDEESIVEAFHVLKLKNKQQKENWISFLFMN